MNGIPTNTMEKLEARLAGNDSAGQPTTHLHARLEETLERERAAIDRERQAIQREREAIQREREAIEIERKRNTSEHGRLKDAEKSECAAIEKERRILAEERTAMEIMREGQEREWEEMMKEKDVLHRREKELEDDRLKLEREVQARANLAANETQALKEAVERAKAERGELEAERQRLRAEVQQLTDAQETAISERDKLRTENERLLGIQRQRGPAGLAVERERVEAELREHDQAELQLARDTVERDKQEIEKIRVEIENIMKAWEVERDRQARERQQIEAEKEEVATLRADAERAWRATQNAGGGIPRFAGIGILPQPAGAAFVGAAAMPTLPSFAAMAALTAAAGQSPVSTPPPSSAQANGTVSMVIAEHHQPQVQLKFIDDKHGHPHPQTPQHQAHHGSTSLTTSPVSTPPSQSTLQPTSLSTPGKRKRKRGDSLLLQDQNGGDWRAGTGVDTQSSSDFSKKRRTVRPWEERFEELLHFKDKHGHFSVPAGGEYASLRIWVNNQKALHTKGQLAADRFEKLNSMGFPWWNPKGNRSGKGRKNEDEETAAATEVKKEEHPQEEDRERRRKELESFFGTPLDSYPGIVAKFAVRNSERVIDNAIVWLRMTQQENESGERTRPLSEKNENDTQQKSEEEKGKETYEEMEREEGSRPLAKERKDKVALLRRIEGIVGLGEDPLRELLEKGGFRVFSSDVSLRREDLDWLTQHYDEIKSAFLLSTFSKKANKGKWNQKLLMNEVVKIYSSFLGFDLQHRNLRTKFLSTLGKAVSEWSYFLAKEDFTLWSHAVCLRAKYLSLLQQQQQREGGAAHESGLVLTLDSDRFLSTPAGDSGRAAGPGSLAKLLNLPYLLSATATASTENADQPPTETAVTASRWSSTGTCMDTDPAQQGPTTTTLGNSDEGVSSLLNSFNLPNFPSYVHKKPFQRRRGSRSVPGASLAALAYQHHQQMQQQMQQTATTPPTSEVIIEEVTSSDSEEEKEATTTTSSNLRGQGATVEEIEDDDEDENVVHHAYTSPPPTSSSSPTGRAAPQQHEDELDLNKADYGPATDGRSGATLANAAHREDTQQTNPTNKV